MSLHHPDRADWQLDWCPHCCHLAIGDAPHAHRNAIAALISGWHCPDRPQLIAAAQATEDRACNLAERNGRLFTPPLRGSLARAVARRKPPHLEVA